MTGGRVSTRESYIQNASGWSSSFSVDGTSVGAGEGIAEELDNSEERKGEAWLRDVR